MVLVVDDEVRIRDRVRRYLEHEGHQVLTAGSGAEALHLATHTQVELIVLDLRLHEIPGARSGEARRVVETSDGADQVGVESAAVCGPYNDRDQTRGEQVMTADQHLGSRINPPPASACRRRFASATCTVGHADHICGRRRSGAVLAAVSMTS